jgi:hypothetical protein
MSDLHPWGNWYYYLRRWVQKCHHRLPQLVSSEWGTAPGSGMADTYCGRHRKPKWAGVRAIDDLPWNRRVVQVLNDDFSEEDTPQ